MGTVRWYFLSQGSRPTVTRGYRARLCAWERRPAGPRLEYAPPAGYVRRRDWGVHSDAGEAVAQAEEEAEGLPDGNMMFNR